MKYVFHEAATKYGLQNMGVTAALSNQILATIGDPVDIVQSWQGDIPPIGAPVSVSILTSKGFTARVDFVATSLSSLTLSAITYIRSDTNEVLYSTTGDVALSEDMSLDALLNGTLLFGGNDTIIGNSGNNMLSGFKGNDQIQGGAGVDTAVFSGLASQYAVTRSGTTISVNGLDGADTLVDVERLRFDNGSVAYDIDGHAGQAYRLYQAALNRKPDAGGLGAQMNGLDSGTSLLQISQNFINSAEFGLKYGTNLSNEAFVTQLYANVLHRAPDPVGFAVQVGALDGGTSRAQLLVNFSESTENYNATIVGIQNGIGYTPVA